MKMESLLLYIINIILTYNKEIPCLLYIQYNFEVNIKFKLILFIMYRSLQHGLVQRMCLEDLLCLTE